MEQQERGIEIEKLPLDEYINKNSRIILTKENVNDSTGRLTPMSGILGYHDENIKFSVDGYDFVYISNEGDIRHVKIIPNQIDGLQNADSLHESDEIEMKLEQAGFNLDKTGHLEAVLKRKLSRNS